MVVPLLSEASDNRERDESLKSESFFDPALLAQSIYRATRFSRTDATHFVAHGSLTLHGDTHPRDLPFTLLIKDGVATVDGVAVIQRLSFGIGSGDWASTDAIPNAVRVNIHLRARRRS